jgi:hypothetical protein
MATRMELLQSIVVTAVDAQDKLRSHADVTAKGSLDLWELFSDIRDDLDRVERLQTEADDDNGHPA